MPHTSSRYQQDLGFSDGIVSFTPESFLTTAGASSIVRNGPGDIALLMPASATTTVSLNVLSAMMARSGFTEDIQDQFGGAGISGSSGPQGRPAAYVGVGKPEPPSGMAALQQITPRTGFKLKGIKPTSITVVYKVLTGAATSINCRMDATTLVNGIAVAPTNVLVNGLNGLSNGAAVTPYVTNIALPLATYYQVTPNSQLWFELSVVEPAANTFQLYGVFLNCWFNFN